MLNKDHFVFTQVELELMYCLKYQSVMDEINSTQDLGVISGLFTQKNEQQEKIVQICELKLAWISEWAKITEKLLNITCRFRGVDLKNELNKTTCYWPESKKHAFLVEVAVFVPYFALSDDVKRYKSLEANQKVMNESIARYFDSKVPKVVLAQKAYINTLKALSKSLSSSNVVLWLSVAAAVSLLVAPYLAAGIGGLMGLSGAAATSAGLAFLGGGSIAVGGFGMAGGYIVTMAGGMLLTGAYTGNQKFAALDNLSAEELNQSCAKLSAFLALESDKLIILNKRNLLKEACSNIRTLQLNFEENTDELYLQNEVKKSKESAKKAATLIAYRVHLRNGIK